MDSQGTRIHIKSVNWYGAESSDFVVAGLQSAPVASIVQQIKALGFNTVRLPWSNQMYETNPAVGAYALTANPSLQGKSSLAILDQVVSALTSQGIMVILDNHNSDAEWCCGTTDGNALWYNASYPEAKWVADWQGMVARYRNNPLVIGADLRNEPRGTATWGGNPSTDWHAASERGGNAILNANPNLLIFVEGVNYALDLSGSSALPVNLNTANHLVYSAHDYGFDYTGLSGYSDYVSRITPQWGFLVTGSHPAPLWIGEFGTCNNADSCITSGNAADGGFWFGFLTTYLQTNDLDWSYWAINGTQSTGSGRTYGAQESYGILNASWNGYALPSLTAAFAALNAPANPHFQLTSGSDISIGAPGQNGTSAIAILPLNSFSGTVNLSCSLSAIPSGAAHLPACSIPATANIAGISATSSLLTVTTTGSSAMTAAIAASPSTWRLAVCGTVLTGLLLCFPARRLRKILLQASTAWILLCIGCGGGSGSGGGIPGPTTTAGKYTFTVVATAPGPELASTKVTVTVP